MNDETKCDFSDFLFANNIVCGVTETDGGKVMGESLLAVRNLLKN